MPSYFTNKPTGFVEVHAGEVGLIAREDLAGLWDDPDLGKQLSTNDLTGKGSHIAHLGAIIFNDRPR